MYGPRFLGEKEGKGRNGWDGLGAQEGRRAWLGQREHSEPFIQHEAGEESQLCVAAKWPHAAAQTHPCGCERAFSAEPQTCQTHLAQSQSQRSR